MQLILISGITIAIGAVVFALQNNAPVVVTLALWTVEGSLALVLLVAEHTWGLDQKEALPDTTRWNRAGLAELRATPEGR